MKNELIYDIVVLGGGPSGVAAAVSAARLGKKVLLAEAGGALGGAANHSLVFPFMPYSTPVGEGRLNLVQGFFQELTDDLAAVPNQRGSVCFDTEVLKCLLDRKVTESGADVLFHATLSGVRKDGNRIEAISLATKAGVLTVSAQVFIDCTGDADLCTYAGVPTVLGRDEDHLCQPMTLCFRVINVDKKTFFENRPVWKALYEEWRAAGKTSNPRENILVFDYPQEGVLHFNTTRVVKLNPVDPFELSKAEMEARKQVLELMEFFRENDVPGMQNAVLLETAASIGVRESRMLSGAYRLTGADLLAFTKFEDAVAAGNYDIDIHNPEGSGTSHYYFPAGTWYTIPYRALTPKGPDAANLLVAGRCISADHEAQASIRIMPICAATGEAAGVAATVAVESGSAVQDVDVKRVQDLLKKEGAFLGI